jgi:GNAT superfamily N-acetyltransferase
MSSVTPGSLAAIRVARFDDVPALERLIAASARGLTRPDYTSEQVEAALGTAWGVDTQLIRDSTYFVAEFAGKLVACGGWSRRGTSFGGDHLKDRHPALLDPTRDAARIRAFFVLPEWARRGLGRMILGHCEQAALDAGFQRVELVATLPGHRLYRTCGYEGDDRVRYELPGKVFIDFIPMRKRLVPG